MKVNLEVFMNKTSLNVSLKMSEKLTDISKKFNISKKQLVAMIFQYCHDNLNFNIQVTGCLTSYQKKAPGDKWKCLRVDFSETECDVYFLYRNLFRISLSKLLAVGFVLFFDMIVAELNGDSDDEKNAVEEIINSYTEIKQLLYNFTCDSFKYFYFENKTIP